MGMKKLCALGIFMLISTALFAGSVDFSTAWQVAENHIFLHGEDNTIARGVTENYNNSTILYIFELAPSGFIVVSSRTEFKPVVAWSFDNDMQVGNNADPGYDIVRKDAILKHENFAILPQDYVDNSRILWSDYLHLPDAFILEVLEDGEYGPWMETRWGQGWPYNMFVPDDPEEDHRSVSGCVATACAQILNYWEFPYSMHFDTTDSYWSTYTDPPIFIDAPTANVDTIDYTGPLGFEPSEEMIGRLLWGTGVSVDMHYSRGGSGTHAFASHFIDEWGYSNATDMERYFYSEPLQYDLVDGKPVYCSMVGEEYGHAIVLEGWRESGEFFCNMGWNGGSDGWYDLFGGGLPSDFLYLTSFIYTIMAPPHPDFQESRINPCDIDIYTYPQKRINAIFGNDVDVYRFYANDDSTYHFWSWGPVDTKIEIFPENGEYIILEADSGGSYGNFDTYFTPEPGQSGYYYAYISCPELNMSVMNYKFYYQRVVPESRRRLLLYYPEGGEEIRCGNEMLVMFTRNGIPPDFPLNLEYSTDGRDGPWIRVSDDVTYYGEVWETPMVTEQKDSCYVRLSVDGYNDAYDINDEPFTILAPENIEETIPEEIMLSAYPNPFNSVLNIEHNNDSPIVIRDIKGREVSRVITDGAGSAKWQPSEDVQSGIYSISTSEGIIRAVYIK